MAGQSPFFPTQQAPALFLDISTVQVVFGCGGSDYVATYDNTLAPGGESTLVFTDLASPCFSASTSEPDNQSNLDSLANQWSKDFLDWFNLQFDYVFDGIAAVQPNGYIDEIEFDHSSEMAKTRIRSMPWNGFPSGLGHEDSSCPSAISGVMLGLTTETITARSGNTFGKGKVQIFDIKTPNMAASGSTITVKNWYSSQIPSGKYCVVIKIGCVPFYLAGDC